MPWMIRLHKMHVYRLLMTVVVFAFVNTCSQAQISTTSYLSDKYTDISNLPYSNTIDFIDNSAKGLPLISGYEFRTETDEFELEQQQYLFRLNFNSRDERKAYDQILATNSAMYTAMKGEYILDKIERDLQNIIDFYFAKQELVNIDQELIILKDRELVLSKLLQQDSEGNISQWLANQDDMLEVYEDSMKVQNEIKVLSSLLFNNTSNSDLDYSDLVTIDNIESIVNAIDLLDVKSSNVLMAQAEEAKAIAEYDLEEAEASRWLEFAQLQYQADDKQSFQNEISFSTSINLPYSANNRIKKNDAAIEVLESKNKRMVEEESDRLVVEGLMLKLESAIIEYRHLQQLIADQKLEETYQAYQRIQNLSPLILLDLQKSILKYKSKLVGIKKEIYKIYLDIISKSGMLTQVPRKNYMSSELTEF